MSGTLPPVPRVALVTGAGGGLGTAIAGALHAAGYCVGVADIDPGEAGRVAAELDPAGDRIEAITLDVRSRPSFEAARDGLLRRWGSVQVLVNNAALTIARPVMEIDADEFDAVMAVNLRGTFLGCQVFGTLFRAAGHGRIVNMGSLAAQNGGTATGAHYAASKGGILTLTKVFARELAAAGVTVNAIAPGPLDLPLTRRTVPAERLQELQKMIPVQSLGDAGFIGRLVVQLAATEAGFVTGATWDVNGGLYTR